MTLTCLLISAGIGAVAQAASAASLENCATTGSLPANDDGSSPAAVPVGFTLNFFGADYTGVYVNNNGNVTFGAALSAFTPSPIGSNPPKIIAPFWADVDTQGAGSALTTYGTTAFLGHNAFCVNWDGVGYFSTHTDKLNKFQLLLVDRSDVGAGDFDIVFNYQQVLWETGDASGGSGGLGGSSARAGYSDGVSNSYELPGSNDNGAFLNGSPTGLVSGSANSSTPGQYIYRVRNGSPLAADVSITKTAQPDPATVGVQLTYGLAVHNAGPDAAADVQITDSLPAGVSFVSADPGCTEASGTVTCSLGSMGNGTDQTRNIVVTPTQANAELSNTATVSTSTGDPNLGNNSSTSTIAVNANSCPTPAPNAPGTPTASGGDQQATVYWAAPTGPTPDSYTVYVHQGETTTTVPGITATRVQIDGLQNGQTYSFTVAGVNCAGPGPQSGSSNDVVPAPGTSAEVIGPGNLSQSTGTTAKPTTTDPEIGVQQFPTGSTGIGTLRELPNSSAGPGVATLNFCNGVSCLGSVLENRLINGTVGGRFYRVNLLFDRTLATGTGTKFKVWYDGNLGDDNATGGDPTPPRLLPRCVSTFTPPACVAKIVRLESRDLKVMVRTNEIDPRIGVR